MTMHMNEILPYKKIVVSKEYNLGTDIAQDKVYCSFWEEAKRCLHYCSTHYLMEVAVIFLGIEYI